MTAPAAAEAATAVAAARASKSQPDGGGQGRTGPSRAAAVVGHPVVRDGAGVVLALITWCWVLLPYLRGGPPEVKAVLYAKFLNRKPDGSVLP